MAIRRQEMNSVPNKDKEAEHHEPPRASTDACEAEIAGTGAAGEYAADEFVAKLIASRVPIITSDEMWEDLDQQRTHYVAVGARHYDARDKQCDLGYNPQPAIGSQYSPNSSRSFHARGNFDPAS